MKENWDDNGAFTQALILAFDQICEHDEAERDAQLAGAGKPSKSAAPKSPKPSKGRRRKR